jgi:hypothetical protein
MPGSRLESSGTGTRFATQPRRRSRRFTSKDFFYDAALEKLLNSENARNQKIIKVMADKYPVRR